MQLENITLQEKEIMESAIDWSDVHDIKNNTRFTRDALQKKLPEMVEKGLLASDETEKTYYYRTASTYLPLVYANE